MSLPGKVCSAHKKAPALLAPSTANSNPMVTESIVPAWFSDSLAMLKSLEIPLDEDWAELVRLWAAFEEKERFKERGKLSARHHPECIAEWQQQACFSTWQPVITNVAAFKKVFHVWWVSLQPKWRVSGKGTILTEGVEGDWENLRKPGLNGLLSTLASFFYWSKMAQKNVKQRKAWARDVENYTLVLCHLLG
jgi:hypothetical protein